LAGGAVVSLVAFGVIQLDKFVSPGEAQDWHDKYGKLAKIFGPVAAILGLLLLVW
jgi:hypothetical protein